MENRFSFTRSYSFHRLFPIVAGIVAFIVYLQLAWFVLSPQTIWVPDTGAKLLQLQSLRIENGRLAHDIAYPGREIDPDLQFAQHNPFIHVEAGKQQFQRLPIFPILSFPFFALLGLPGAYILPALCGALLGVLALGLLRPTDRRVAMWILVAWASPIVIYATSFWEHTVASCLALSGAWLAFRLGPIKLKAPVSRVIGWMVVGILSGLAILIRLEIVFFVVALLFSCWFIMREGRWGPFWAISPLVAGGAIYIPLHLRVIGARLPEHAGYLFYPLRYLISATWRSVPDFLIGPVADNAVNAGFLGELWAVAAVAVLAYSIGQNSDLIQTIRLILLGGTAIIGAIFLFTAELYQAAHGFLFTTPWAILGLSRAYDVWRQGDWRAKIVVLTTVVGMAGYIIGLVGIRGASPHGAREWGMRFAMTFYPLLALIAAWDLGAKRRQWQTVVIVAALMFLGIGFQIRGLSVIRQDKLIHSTLNRMIVETPEAYIVSDLWWLSLNAAPIYQQKAIFIAVTPERLRDWINLAVTKQIKTFAMVTLNENLPNHISPMLAGYRLDVVEVQRIGNLHLFRLAIQSG